MVAGVLRSVWSRAHHQAGHLVTALTAEAALHPGFLLGPGGQLGDLRGDRLTVADHDHGQVDAAVADVDAGARDQLLDLLLILAAERAHQQPRVGPDPVAAQPAAGTAGRLDDLVHPLVAEAQAGGELAQGRAVQVQAAYRPVEVGPGHIGVTLGVDQPFLGLPGLGQQRLVHAVYCN